MRRVAALFVCFAAISAGTSPAEDAGDTLPTTSQVPRLHGRELRDTATAGTLPQ